MARSCTLVVACIVLCTSAVAHTATAAVPPVVDNRPMVGILALPNYFDGFTGRSYIAASYVKWVEARLHGFDKRPNDNMLYLTLAVYTFPMNAAEWWCSSGSHSVHNDSRGGC